MTPKKTKVILVLLFLLLVAALPTVCVFIPYQEPTIEYEIGLWDYSEEEDGTLWVDWYVAGEFNNPSIVDIEEVNCTLVFFDESGMPVETFDVVINEKISRYSTQEFFQYGLITDKLWFDCAITEIEYSYETLAPWVYYTSGLILFGISTMFFMKKKLYFDVGSHKVEVFASMSKATLMIDGKTYKQLAVQNKTEVDSCSFKVSGQVLTLSLRMGIFFPDVEITVDGVVPKFTRIQQHSFLKSTSKEKTTASAAQTSASAAPATKPQTSATAAPATKPQASATVPPATQQAPKVPAQQNSKLQQLEDLYRKGVITKEEFIEYRKQFVNK